MEPIRIEIIEDESGNPQARTYAEYKVFSALVRHAPQVRSARIALRRADHQGCLSVACAVTVAVEPTGSVRAEARGPHAFAAVNRTVERLASLMSGRAA
ncbi:MAG TPA: HPF/RaiA family ribosome-associated protein [Vicinamibacterales bacterium]|nr:HPF/RaiA family ribosome-associated protein [Vicinamibacterales bacterium]